MFCRFCGKEISEDSRFCPHCGKVLQAEDNASGIPPERDGGFGPKGPEDASFSGFGGGAPYGNSNPYNGNTPPNYGNMPPYARQPAPDVPNIGWGILGFFFPLIGLIMFLVWHDEYPNRARMCGKGALISVIVGVGAAILMFVFLFAILGLVGCSAL